MDREQVGRTVKALSRHIDAANTAMARRIMDLVKRCEDKGRGEAQRNRDREELYHLYKVLRPPMDLVSAEWNTILKAAGIQGQG